MSRDHWLAQLLGHGEDPLQWSLPLFRVAGVQMRLHLVLVAWAAAELMISARPDVQGPLHRLSVVTALVGIVVLREVVRAALLWGRGWLPDRMVMWQGGALSSPVGLSPRLLAPCAGLAISGLLVVFSGLLMLAARMPAELLVTNPLDPTSAASSLRSVPQIALFWAYYASVVVLGLNLLPMPPMEMGRLVQCLAARPLGQRAALRAAAHLGLSVGVTLCVFGIVAEQMRLVGIAMIGIAVCWIELRRLAFIEDATVNPALDLVEWIEGISLTDFEEGPEAPVAAETPVRALDFPSLDEVLDKVSRLGLESLTKVERDVLRRETERLRERHSGS